MENDTSDHWGAKSGMTFGNFKATDQNDFSSNMRGERKLSSQMGSIHVCMKQEKQAIP